MISDERIKEIYNIIGDQNFKLNLTHQEIQEFLSTIGYKTIETEMLVTINHKTYDGGEVRTNHKSNGIRPVILSIPVNDDPPTRDQHLNDHRDKFYFEVCEREIKKRLVDLLFGRNISNQVKEEDGIPKLYCPYDFTSRCTMGRCNCKLKK